MTNTSEIITKEEVSKKTQSNNKKKSALEIKIEELKTKKETLLIELEEAEKNYEELAQFKEALFRAHEFAETYFKKEKEKQEKKELEEILEREEYGQDNFIDGSLFQESTKASKICNQLYDAYKAFEKNFVDDFR